MDDQAWLTGTTQLARGIQAWAAWWGDKPWPARSIDLKLSGVGPWKRNGEPVRGWFVDVRSRLVGPVLERVQSGATAMSEPLRELLAVGDGSEGGTIALDGTDQGWHDFLDRLDSGDYAWIRLLEPTPQSYRSFATVLALAETHRTGSVRVSVPFDGLEIAHEPSLQQALVDEIVAGTVAFDALYGELGLDRHRPTSAHEELIAQTDIEGQRSCAELARGYQWGTVLTAGHLERLGGADRVVRDAPAHEVRVFERTEGSPAVFIQLTEDIMDVPDDALRALKRYFEPILPKTTRPEFRYIGPPRRFIEE